MWTKRMVRPYLTEVLLLPCIQDVLPWNNLVAWIENMRFSDTGFPVPRATLGDERKAEANDCSLSGRGPQR
jgi:hypothetical protein